MRAEGTALVVNVVNAQLSKLQHPLRTKEYILQPWMIYIDYNDWRCRWAVGVGQARSHSWSRCQPFTMTYSL